MKGFYRFTEKGTGRLYQLGDLGAPGGGAPSKGNPHYEFLGVSRYWRFSETRMQSLYAEGRIVQTRPGTVPRLKRYLDEGKGVPLGSVWDDIGPVQGAAHERIGYPTQKPLKLLERIIEISSNEGDIVLDAFCGCGTALVAAQSMGRQWIGIDVSPTACRVMAKRLRDSCGLAESETLWRANRGFVVRDFPWTQEKLRKLPPFEFENWAVVAIGGLPNATKVGDIGIDGRIFPVTSIPKTRVTEDSFAFMDEWFPVQVKQKDKAGRPDIDSFEAVMTRERRNLGFFVAFDFSVDAEREVRRFHSTSGREIRLVRVSELIDMDHERMVLRKKPVGSVRPDTAKSSLEVPSKRSPKFA